MFKICILLGNLLLLIALNNFSIYMYILLYTVIIYNISIVHVKSQPILTYNFELF